MGARKASEGIRILQERTAGARVKATVTVDQVYARFQHETLYFRHPRGGRAKYLEAPLFETFEERIGRFAEGLLHVEEESAESRWGHAVGDPLVNDVYHNAPIEFGEWLRNSASLTVTVGGGVVRYTPPKQRRLSDEEIHRLEPDLRWT